MAALQPHANDLMHVMNRVGVGGEGWLAGGGGGRRMEVEGKGRSFSLTPMTCCMP